MTRPEEYRDIRLEDIDRAILEWFDHTVDAHVDIPDGRRYKVPVTLAVSERWSLNAVPRDSSDRLILPAISVIRTNLDPTNGMLSLGSNVPRLQISKRVSGKTENLIRNRLTRDPLLSEGPKPVVYEVTTIPFPFNGSATYELNIYAQYMGHINSIIERIMMELEFFDVPSFVAPLSGDGLPRGMGPSPGELRKEEELPYSEREPTDGYYVCGYFDGPFDSDSNIKDFTDQERVLKYVGTFSVPVFLQLNPPDKRESVQVEYTAFKVEFGKEGQHFPDTDEEIELLFSGKKIGEKVRRR